MNAKAKRAIFILVFSEFLVCLGISLVIPVMPFLKNQLHLTAADMGIMTSLYALAQLVGSPIIGMLSDRIGRRPLLVLGLGLFMVSEFVFAISNQLIMFDISRIIGGISGAMVVPTAMAMAADITTERQRARVIGWLSASFSGGLILGPGIGGMLANVSYKLPFWCAGVLGFLSMLTMFFFLPKESELGHHLKAVTTPKKVDWKKFMTGPIILLLGLILVSAFGLAGFEGIYSVYVNEVFDFSINNIAIVLILNGIISLVLQVVFFDRLIEWLTEIKVIRYSFLFSTIGVLWILFAQTKIEVVIATLLVFSAMDVIRPAITTLLTKFSRDGQGFLNGLNMSLTSVGNIIGPSMAGFLLDVNYHYPYMIVVVVLTLSVILTYALKKPKASHQA